MKKKSFKKLIVLSVLCLSPLFSLSMLGCSNQTSLKNSVDVDNNGSIKHNNTITIKKEIKFNINNQNYKSEIDRAIKDYKDNLDNFFITVNGEKQLKDLTNYDFKLPLEISYLIRNILDKNVVKIDDLDVFNQFLSYFKTKIDDLLQELDFVNKDNLFYGFVNGFGDKYYSKDDPENLIKAEMGGIFESDLLLFQKWLKEYKDNRTLMVDYRFFVNIFRNTVAGLNQCKSELSIFSDYLAFLIHVTKSKTNNSDFSLKGNLDEKVKTLSLQTELHPFIIKSLSLISYSEDEKDKFYYFADSDNSKFISENDIIDIIKWIIDLNNYFSTITNEENTIFLDNEQLINYLATKQIDFKNKNSNIKKQMNEKFNL